MQKIAAFTIMLLSFTSYATPAHAQMMGTYTITDDGHTAQEEAEGKSIVEKLTKGDGSVTCTTLTDDDFERMGEYYMGLMVGDAHVAMNAMMTRQLGEDGEEQMHLIMGKRLSGCEPTAGTIETSWGSSWFPMMSMMNGISGGSWRYGMMSGFSASGWNTLSIMTMGLFWTVGILAIIVLVRMLLAPQKNNKK